MKHPWAAFAFEYEKNGDTWPKSNSQANLVVQAVERPHFLAQPIFVPIVNRDDALGLAGNFAADVSDG